MTTLEFCSIAFNVLLTIIFVAIYFYLRREIKSVELFVLEKLDKLLVEPPLDEEQSQYKKKIDTVWQLAMDQQVKSFNAKLLSEFKKAEEKINFEKIKYKKTISQKRKIARKQLPDLPNESSWRDINES